MERVRIVITDTKNKKHVVQDEPVNPTYNYGGNGADAWLDQVKERFDYIQEGETCCVKIDFEFYEENN